MFSMRQANWHRHLDQFFELPISHISEELFNCEMSSFFRPDEWQLGYQKRQKLKPQNCIIKKI